MFGTTDDKFRRFIIQIPDGRFMVKLSVRSIELLFTTRIYPSPAELRENFNKIISEYCDPDTFKEVTFTKINGPHPSTIYSTYVVKVKEMKPLIETTQGVYNNNMFFLPFNMIRRIYNIPDMSATRIMSESNKEAVVLLERARNKETI